MSSVYLTLHGKQLRIDRFCKVRSKTQHRKWTIRSLETETLKFVSTHTANSIKVVPEGQNSKPKNLELLMMGFHTLCCDSYFRISVHTIAVHTIDS